MDELRVVLVGKTGSGKSALGNTLLGFNAFDSERGLSSGTKKCNWAAAKVDGITLSTAVNFGIVKAHVIAMAIFGDDEALNAASGLPHRSSHLVTDTPGLCDTHRSEEDILKEIGKSMVVSCPGPHVVIIVLRVDQRFTDEEHQAVKALLKLFGEGVRSHLMAVFVGGDSFEVPISRMQAVLEEDIKNAPIYLKEVLCDTYDRYCVVDNKGSFEARRPHAQVVLKLIQDVFKRNHGKFYTNNMVASYDKEMQKTIQRHQEEQNLSTEEAVKQSRKSVVEEKEEPSYFQTLTNVTKDYILPVVTNAAVAGAATMVASRCSVM